MLNPDATNPAMYGPEPVRRPMMDTMAPLADALQNLDPEMAYVLDQVGKGVQRQQGSELLFDAAKSGETVESLQGQVKAAQASDSALKLAEQSLQVSDQEFEQILAQIQGEARPEMPTMEQPQSPNRIAQILAAGLSIADPKNAFAYGAAPFQMEQAQRQQRYQENAQRYGEQMAARAEKMDFLEVKLRMAEKRRAEASEEVRRLADEAFKRGEKMKSEALSVRARIYDSKTTAEVDDLLKVMRENYPPEFLPAKETIDGLKSSIKAAQDADIQKAKFQADKEEGDRVAGVLDDFRAWVLAQYPSGVSIGPAEVKIINDEAKRISKEHNVPLAKFNQYYERTAPATQNADLAERRYEEAEDMRNIALDIKKVELDQKKATLEKALAAEPVEGAGKKAKRKQIGSLTTKAENAKLALDQHLNQSPKEDDAGGAEYWRRARELLIDEYTIVAKKRQMAGGKVPTILEYFKERFPNDSGVFSFNPLRGGINNTGRGTSQQGNPVKIEPSLPSGIK